MVLKLTLQGYGLQSHLKSWHEIVTKYICCPTEVIWEQLHYCMFLRKCMETVPVPETNGYSGSGSGTNDTNFTLPFAQRNPFPLFLYFNALQCTNWVYISNSNALVGTVVSWNIVTQSCSWNTESRVLNDALHVTVIT
jgi:hypothetical protein